MTTTQTERVDLSRGLARIDPRMGGQFPPLGQMPKAATEPVEALMKLRERLADANELRGEAFAAVEKAKLADATALLEHVRGGGKAAEFRGTTPAALQDLEYAQADVSMLERLINEQTLDSCLAVQRLHDEGAELAGAAVEKAAQRYTETITALQKARQDYVNACGVQLFWRYLVEKGYAIVPGGDTINLNRGPVTRVDTSTITLLRQDAETHLRARDAIL